jgi:ammonium transporter
MLPRLPTSPGAALGLLSALLLVTTSPCCADAPPPSSETVVVPKKEWEDLQKKVGEVEVKADSSWMLTASGLVMLMVPGLALFYGGMVRRKNILATMMHSMIALAVVGVYWFAVGYALAFGDPWIKLGEGKNTSILGWNKELLFLRGVEPSTLLPGGTIPVYLHVLFQGMFAIITPALISGAVAERIRFKPYCLFLLAWVTFVYCPLAHMVWAQNWNWQNALAAQPDPELLAKSGTEPVGLLGGYVGALDFAGGTVVHIAAGFSGLAAILVLRRRLGYLEHSFHPSSMVLTLTGAGLLWFGWFGFNGGSAVASGSNATSAFAATQAAAAAAGLSWVLVEWCHRGKPTALGLASGIVAGLVAVTPASGFVYPAGGLFIGLAAGALCYLAVNLKPYFRYDDSLDAFGVHGVGGFLGAVLTGVFCSKVVNASGADGLLYGNAAQVSKQTVAAVAAAGLSLVGSLLLVRLLDALLGFTTSPSAEIEGLDQTEHGEAGFDFGLATEEVPRLAAEPRPALVPPNGSRRFSVVVEGLAEPELIRIWSDLCQPQAGPPAPEFRAVYPYVTTVQGNRFRFRGGDPSSLRDNLEKLFQRYNPNRPIRAHLEPA